VGFKLPIQDLWQSVYDETTESIKTTSAGPAPGSEVNIKGYDGTDWQNIYVTELGGRYLLDVNIAAGNIDIAQPTDVRNGRRDVTTAGTAEPIILDSILIEDKVTIKANEGNTGNIYVGNNSVTNANGLILSAGESVDLKIDDLSKVYVDADVAGDGISYIAS